MQIKLCLPLLLLISQAVAKPKDRDIPVSDYLNSLLDEGRRTLDETYQRPIHTDRKWILLRSYRWPSPPTGNEVFEKIPGKVSGIRLTVPRGGKIACPLSGIVKYVGSMGDEPQAVIVDHRQQLQTIFLGMDKVNARLGQSVYAGQSLGSVPTYGPEKYDVYFEVRYKGKTIDPLPYLKKQR